MVYLFEKNIIKNKLVFLAISAIYGLNMSTAFWICQLLGFLKNLKIKQLTLKQTNKINIRLGNLNQKFSNDLKNFKSHRKKQLLITRSYKALRLFKKLPIRGQWTHTNAKTAKKNLNQMCAVLFFSQ